VLTQRTIQNLIAGAVIVGALIVAESEAGGTAKNAKRGADAFAVAPGSCTAMAAQGSTAPSRC
jgi:hypothetical protein